MLEKVAGPYAFLSRKSRQITGHENPPQPQSITPLTMRGTETTVVGAAFAAPHPQGTVTPPLMPISLSSLKGIYLKLVTRKTPRAPQHCPKYTPEQSGRHPIIAKR